MENEIKKEKKGGSGALIIALLIILCLVGYICYDKVLAPTDKKESSTSTEVKEITDKNCECSKEETTTDTSSSTKTCEGEYRGEWEHGNYTYYLKKDGTFKANYSGLEEADGVYVINGNTITLVQPKHTVGPSDQDPSYTSSDYVMADDCSYFVINIDNTAMKMVKK